MSLRGPGTPGPRGEAIALETTGFKKAFGPFVASERRAIAAIRGLLHRWIVLIFFKLQGGANLTPATYATPRLVANAEPISVISSTERALRMTLDCSPEFGRKRAP